MRSSSREQTTYKVALSIKGGEKEAAVGKRKNLSLILILMKSEA